MLTAFGAILDTTSATISFYNGAFTLPVKQKFQNSNDRMVITSENIEVPPNSEKFIQVSVSPMFNNIEAHVQPLNRYFNGLLIASAVVIAKDNVTLLRVLNATDNIVKLKRNVHLARITPFHEPPSPAYSHVSSLHDTNATEADTSTSHSNDFNKDTPVENSTPNPSWEEKEAVLTKIGLKLENDELTADERHELIDLLYKYRD